MTPLAHIPHSPIALTQQWRTQISRHDLHRQPIIDLAQAIPNQPVPLPLREHLARAIHQEPWHLYTPNAGIPALRDAYAQSIAQHYHSPNLTAEHILISAGCNQAFALLMMALAKAGDEVILPLPAYFNHSMWLNMLGIHPRYLPHRPLDGALPDPRDAQACINHRTKAIVLVSPNNPTGAVYPPELLDRFHHLARKHHIFLVLDETYRDYLTPEQHHHLFAQPQWAQHFAHLYSFSKAYALAGYRVGALACDPTLRQEVEKAMDCVAICAPTPGQAAALFALEHLQTWRKEQCDAINARCASLRLQWPAAHPFRLCAAGAYFAYLQHPFPHRNATNVAKELALHHHLLLLPGSAFGPEQEPYLRMAFANVTQQHLSQVITRLQDAACQMP